MRSSKAAWRLALRVAAAAAGLALFAPPVAPAQETVTAQAAAKASDAELAKKLSNPIADLVSVPFQFNWAQGTGPDEETRFVLNGLTSPEGGPEWQLRGAIVVLLPRKR
jgi:hypothetical protein